VHRVLWAVLVGGGVLGLVLGWWAHRVVEGQASAWWLLGAALVVGALGGPLTWVASVVLSRPLVRLARVASQLREGQLTERASLPVDGDQDLDHVSEALDGLAERVSRQLADQRALLAAVSHELRSPLGRLRVLVELQREGHAPDDVHDRIQAEIDGMDRLVADLLAGARIDFEAVAPKLVSARSLAQRAVQAAEVSVSITADDETVRVDPTLMVRALVGLLDNARAYGGGVVAVRVRADGDWVRFEVDDDGPGFADGEAEQAFQPFWRRPGQEEGTGLGLALVRQIAEVHDGRAGATGREGGGARVWLEVPRRGA